MLPLVTEFSLILPEFSRFFLILGGVTPPHLPVATPLNIHHDLVIIQSRLEAIVLWALKKTLGSVAFIMATDLNILLTIYQETLIFTIGQQEMVILIFIALDLNLNQTVVNHFQYQ